MTSQVNKPWICEHCEYMNEYSQIICEVCKESSAVRGSTLCNDSIKFTIESAPISIKPKPDTKITSEEKSYNKPMSTTITKNEVKETPSSPNPAEIPKMRRSSLSGEHICFRDADSIYCIICNEPMLFLFANDMPYPSGFPTKLFEKRALLEKTLTENAYFTIINGLNGGEISGAEKHAMFTIDNFLGEFDKDINVCKIEITINDMVIVYSGPSRGAISQIFSAAISRYRPIILPTTIINNEINDQMDMCIIIYPDGNVFCVDPSLDVHNNPDVEVLFDYVFKGIKSELKDNLMLRFVPHAHWNKKCAKLSQTYLKFAKLPSWKPMMFLLFMSILSINMTIKDAIAFLQALDDQEISFLLDSAIERIITALAP